MLVNILTSILGILIFLFVFWKRLKDDYSSEIIFQTAAAILIGIGVACFLSSLFFAGWFFWAAFVGSIISMLLMRIRFKLRFFETLEALILASMPLIALIFLQNSITTSSLRSFLAFTIVLVMIFIFYWIDVNYKSFRWYKSGKVGFAGLAMSTLFFLTRAILAIFGVAMLSLVGKFEIVISGAMAVASLGLLLKLRNG
jgi:hypothetical protein